MVGYYDHGVDKKIRYRKNIVCTVYLVAELDRQKDRYQRKLNLWHCYQQQQHIQVTPTTR